MQTVRPLNSREFMDKLVNPYDKQVGNPNIIPSQPFKPGQPEFNRAYEVSFKDIEDKKYSIGIKDIDEAVMYYFEKVLQLSVYQNNSQITVPIIYGSPENWKAVQRDGYYRDGAAKIMTPLIMFKRESVTQNRSLGNKLDGNKASNVQLFKKSFSRRNVYDNFHILQGQKLQDEYTVVVTPDYVTMSYKCIMWTTYVEQMDKLIEAVNFASNSYWGDPSKFQFLAKIDSFEDALTTEAGDDRLVRTNFTITLNGYLIPDTINAYLAQLSNKTYNLCKIVFNTETVQVTDASAKYSTAPVQVTMPQTRVSGGSNVGRAPVPDTRYNLTIGFGFILYGVGKYQS